MQLVGKARRQGDRRAFGLHKWRDAPAIGKIPRLIIVAHEGLSVSTSGAILLQ